MTEKSFENDSKIINTLIDNLNFEMDLVKAKFKSGNLVIKDLHNLKMKSDETKKHINNIFKIIDININEVIKILERRKQNVKK